MKHSEYNGIQENEATEFASFLNRAGKKLRFLTMFKLKWINFFFHILKEFPRHLTFHQHLTDTVLCQPGGLFLKTRHSLSICEGECEWLYTCLHSLEIIPRHSFSCLRILSNACWWIQILLFQEILPDILLEFFVFLFKTIKYT